MQALLDLSKTAGKPQENCRKTAGKLCENAREEIEELAAISQRLVAPAAPIKIRCVAVPLTVTGPLVYMTNPVLGAAFWCNAGHRWRSQP